MNYQPPANTVFYRHPCDCDTASRPLAEGEKAVHRFEVDGAELPWHISDKGARFTRLQDGLYRVDVEILALTREGGRYVDLRITGRVPARLLMGGAVFPWTIAEDGVRITASRTELPSVALGFFAHSVDTDTEIVDARSGRAVYDADGNYYGGQEHCPHCDAAITDRAHPSASDIFEHIRAEHPGMVRTSGDGETGYCMTPTNHTTEGEKVSPGGRGSDQ